MPKIATHRVVYQSDTRPRRSTCQAVRKDVNITQRIMPDVEVHAIRKVIDEKFLELLGVGVVC